MILYLTKIIYVFNAVLSWKIGASALIKQELNSPTKSQTTILYQLKSQILTFYGENLYHIRLEMSWSQIWVCTIGSMKG